MQSSGRVWRARHGLASHACLGHSDAHHIILSESVIIYVRTPVFSVPLAGLGEPRDKPFDFTPFDLAQGLRQGHEQGRMARDRRARDKKGRAWLLCLQCFAILFLAFSVPTDPEAPGRSFPEKLLGGRYPPFDPAPASCARRCPGGSGLRAESVSPFYPPAKWTSDLQEPFDRCRFFYQCRYAGQSPSCDLLHTAAQGCAQRMKSAFAQCRCAFRRCRSGRMSGRCRA